MCTFSIDSRQSRPDARENSESHVVFRSPVQTEHSEFMAARLCKTRPLRGRPEISLCEISMEGDAAAPGVPALLSNAREKRAPAYECKHRHPCRGQGT